MIDIEILKQVDRQLIDRYSNRYHQFGVDPRTLGWDKTSSQETRFAVAVNSIDFSNKTILDIGCGFADFYGFLDRQFGVEQHLYTGFDINPDLIEECQKKYPQSDFDRVNILIDSPLDRTWDIVTLFGILNFRFQEFENLDFAKSTIEKAFELCNEALVVDMLSAKFDRSYPPEDFVYYYNPLEMLDFALNLTPHVILRHDYASIPQREFMLILRKEP